MPTRSVSVLFHLSQILLLTLAVLLAAGPLRATEEKKQAFDLPAGPAEPSLKEFSEQSGQQLLFPTKLVKGAQTNAVKGEFTARDALDRMLANTGLMAGRDEKTGAFAVWRVTNDSEGGANSSEFPVRTSKPTQPMPKQSSSSIRRLLTIWTAISSASVFAQTAPAPKAAEEDKAVEMSVYNVSSTQDKGYIANSATPFKTRQQTIDIPQAITVMTRDMISDISGYDSSDVLIYAGAVPKFGTGESFQLRGSNTGVVYPLLDGQINRTIFEDNAYVDSIEVIRGPAALLYPNSALSGVINKTSRRPQSRAKTSVDTSVTDFGLYRAVVDTTGPIGMLGAGQLNFRAIGGYQGGKAFWNRTKDDREFFHPSLQWSHGGTTIFVAYDYMKLKRPSNPTGVLQPDGRVFTGIGLKNSLFLPPGAEETHIHHGARASMVQQFSRNWEMRIGLDYNQMHRRGSIVLPTGGVNWDTRTISLFNRRNNIVQNHGSISIDTNGTYELFGMKQQTTFGGTLTAQKAITKVWANEDFGGPGVRFNVRPIDNPQLDSIRVKPYNEYVAPASPGSRIRSEFMNVYLQQSVDVIKDRLTLIGGVAKYNDETSNVPNIRTNVAQQLGVSPRLYRAGAVLHLFDKAVTFYAMQATTQLPPTTSTLIDGTPAPAAKGKGKEVGVKFKLLDDRVNATVSAYDLTTSGLTVFGGVLPSGVTYVLPLGQVKSKGVDGDLSISFSRNWEFLGTFYSGTVKDQTGNPVDDSYKSSISGFSKYRVTDGALKGAAFGGGFSRVAGRVTSTSALTYVGKPAFLTNKSEILVTAFANYELNKNWFFKVQVDNLLNKVYALGINSATLVAPGIGRTFTFHAGYRF